jgi:DNA transformation protein
VVELSALRKIGPESAAWLRSVGVETLADLERLGAVEAWRRARRAYPDRVTLNLLYALEAGLLDLPWTELPAEVKRRLAAEARAHSERDLRSTAPNGKGTPASR